MQVKKNYLNRLLEEFCGEKNILCRSMENIINNPSLRMINIEEFFDKLNKVFDRLIVKMDEIYAIHLLQ